jgi:hypothetical protein
MKFDGQCPFLRCLITEPHEHPECKECGAVHSTVDGPCGNLYCKLCPSNPTGKNVTKEK